MHVALEPRAAVANFVANRGQVLGESLFHSREAPFVLAHLPAEDDVPQLVDVGARGCVGRGQLRTRTWARARVAFRGGPARRRCICDIGRWSVGEWRNS